MPSLKELVGQELDLPVDHRVHAMAEAIARKHGAASRAVLFYGSCLRQKQIDGLMLDFYLIVSSYREAYGSGWLAAANRLIPPNVFYFEHEGLAAKYAVLSQADFNRLNGPGSPNITIWARFAQPARLIWAADQAARQSAIAAVAKAAPTLLGSVGEVETGDPLDRWRRAFALTYATEWRPERKEKSGSVVDADAGRYLRFTAPALAEAERLRLKPANWIRLRLLGRTLHLFRLAKGSVTFAGAADYIAWKINRHAGTDIQLKPWQRRWPLLAAITLLPRLLRSGAVR